MNVGSRILIKDDNREGLSGWAGEVVSPDRDPVPILNNQPCLKLKMDCGYFLWLPASDLILQDS